MTVSHNRQTILIVDDNPINIQVLARALSERYQVKIANSGLKALEIVKKQEIDLVLLDIEMPEMNGYDVCQQLKRDRNTMEIPVIFVTARDELEFEEKGLLMGAVDYISKPFHLPIVKARVATHMRLRRNTKLLEKLAAIDGLTEIPNRRSFEETLEREWNRAKRNFEPLAILMLDVDHFKQYNDSAGHAAGDTCLKTIAKTLSNRLQRKSDFLARYGGEEFAAILPDTDSYGALNVGQTMRKAVESVGLIHLASENSSVVTLSVGGAAASPQKELQAADVLHAADQMLYKSKNEGRNRVNVIDVHSGEELKVQNDRDSKATSDRS